MDLHITTAHVLSVIGFLFVSLVTVLVWIFNSVVRKDIERLGTKIDSLIAVQPSKDLELATVKIHMENLHKEMFQFLETAKNIHIIDHKADTALQATVDIRKMKDDLTFLHDKVRKLERHGEA